MISIHRFKPLHQDFIINFTNKTVEGKNSARLSYRDACRLCIDKAKEADGREQSEPKKKRARQNLGVD